MALQIRDGRGWQRDIEGIIVRNIFIVGCGYIGNRVAKIEKARGSEVSALVRSKENAKILSQKGINTFIGDLDTPHSLANISIANNIVYYLSPPPAEGKKDHRIVSFLSSLKQPKLPKKIILISTTGVYGDCGGKWITEEQPTNPQTDRAYRRLAAEISLTEWCKENNIDYVILRVPGIYGPHRLPEKSLQQKNPVLIEEDAPFSNRIHADDLAAICIAAADRGKSASIYNIGDGHPTSMTDYFNRVSDILEIPRPPVVTMSEAKDRISPAMLSYLMESKRISNKKMLNELQIELLYPDLSSGLPASLKSN